MLNISLDKEKEKEPTSSEHAGCKEEEAEGEQGAAGAGRAAATHSQWNEGTGLSINYPTVCPGSSDPPEKMFKTFASENEFYTIY